MIIYQVKIIIQAAAHQEWLHWMRTVHVSDLIATGLISSYQIWKVDNPEEIEYCFNYYFANERDCW